MSDLVISATGLSKVYQRGVVQAPYRTLRESITNAFLAPFRRAERPEKARAFYALRDVSFGIKRGEAVGIIGRNGAGKSTLLKILSRITTPTEGWAEVRGRIGSLLEVGTGFHPELTGRENIYLNSAILGMSRAEIKRHFDEIVAFAELEEFIDTPVKHYSSGMYLRLAFAAAAHLDTDILLLDEVLAVGDARFQRKCLNKMQDVGQHGRTVIFVSHSMPAITRLCQRVLLLDEGNLVKDGPAADVVSVYLQSGLGTSAAREWSDQARAPGAEIARLCAVRARGADGRVSDAMDIRQPVHVEVEYEVIKPDYLLVPHFMFTNQDGVYLFPVFDTDPEWRRRPKPVGRYVSSVTIPGNFLAEGTVFITVGMFTIEPIIKQFYERDVAAFQMVDSIAEDTARGEYAGLVNGVIRPLLQWTTRREGP